MCTFLTFLLTTMFPFMAIHFFVWNQIFQVSTSADETKMHFHNDTFSYKTWNISGHGDLRSDYFEDLLERIKRHLANSSHTHGTLHNFWDNVHKGWKVVKNKTKSLLS